MKHCPFVVDSVSISSLSSSHTINEGNCPSWLLVMVMVKALDLNDDDGEDPMNGGKVKWDGEVPSK